MTNCKYKETQGISWKWTLHKGLNSKWLKKTRIAGNFFRPLTRTSLRSDIRDLFHEFVKVIHQDNRVIRTSYLMKSLLVYFFTHSHYFCIDMLFLLEKTKVHAVYMIRSKKSWLADLRRNYEEWTDDVAKYSNGQHYTAISSTAHPSTIQHCPAKLSTVPACKSASGQRTFLYHAMSFWNSLPREIRECDNLPIFKRHLKEFLCSF